MNATMSVKGTFGHLDPEYLSSHRLTEKSDVYSFGVLLLEIISGRASIDVTLPRDQMNICEWARPYFNEGRIKDIADPRLTTYNKEAMWKIAEIAVLSVELPGIDRPSMSDIVIALKKAIAIENNKSHRSLSDTNSLQSFRGSKKKRYYSCPHI
ncbi:hypothetical protein O6H91_20G047400 [Diphasiastrum complanatum]|uniref:Uncharacterized protein n=1 Tax=Diphasiastrum complanatum TaxID=34168 RepID=A0ACC2AR62_DIPCM|nr:hypothetical protein O6H91_20G047400 [Diphasiastrum complanatum]